MGSNYEPDETENHLWSTDSNEEMKFRLKSLRSLVFDLLKTNQELRDALVNARSEVQFRKMSRSQSMARRA